MDRTGVYLEITDPKQLRAAPEVPELVLDEVSASAAPTICRLYNEIWEDSGRSGWSPERWAGELSPPHIRTWIAKIGEQPVGFAEIGWQGNGHVAIVVIGVIPSFQGRGIGGDFLSRLTRLAWKTPSSEGRSTTRVWLWTVPDEHPHTIPNYLSRGFRETQRGNEAD
ncbi:GNAT family N-acetyltransferase [Actinopolymorpha alba]|uniref:GNAT family N-acetyltransferase n=1 Tax=Actinopolymorpha alba TaxID=533267 RepID=UPI000374C063|nr:GNAT family N-acetyltransferase [Actinopolymorpha alba]